MSTVNAPRPSSLNERMSSIHNRANTPVACGECGSTHFYVVRLEEYAETGYSQLRTLTSNSEALYICACGAPLPNKEIMNIKGPETGRTRFLRSLQAALEHRKSNTAGGMASGFVSIAEYQELLERVSALEGTAEWTESALRAIEASSEESEDETHSDTTHSETQNHEKSTTEKPSIEPSTSEAPAPKAGKTKTGK